MELHHLAFRTQRVAEVATFYCTVLGLKVVREQSGRSIWLAVGQGVLMIEQAKPDEPSIPPGSLELFALRADGADREALKSRLLKHGVAIEHETQHTFYFRDPDGRRLGISDYPLEKMDQPR